MRIKCPECSQKFDVTENFLGKTVECGSCDHRFKVTDYHVVAEKNKFYPGEKRDASLDNFGKSSASLDAPVAFAQAHYQPGIHADVVGPPRPRRTVAAILGASILVLVIVVFLLAGGKEGNMRDMETINRFIFVAFTVLIGGGLLFFGTARNKKVGWVAGVVLCLVVLSLPMIFPGNPTSATIIDNAEELDDETINQLDRQQSTEEYLFEIGYDPVRKALVGNKPETVVGIYLRDASQNLRSKIARYLYNATDKVSRETSYDRGITGLNGLILLVEQKKTIDEIALLCETFGRIEKISRDHRVIDVTVENNKVGSLDQDKALDPDDVNFQSQNLKALTDIDPNVQIKAVIRLGNSEPKALRDDITQQMLLMLPEANKELKIELIKALRVWSQPGDGAGKLVMEAVDELHKEGAVDKNGVEFLIQRKIDGVGVILMDLWKKNPVAWAETLKNLGEGAEILLLPILNDLDETQVVVASDILGKVGSQASIAPIQDAMTKMKSEAAKKSMQAAIDEIKKGS